MDKIENHKAVPEIEIVLGEFDYDMQAGRGVRVVPKEYIGTITPEECCSVGGNIVRRLIENAEEQIIGRR